MLDIVLEFARALVVGIILAYFIVLGKREGLEEQKGWKLIVAGFSLLFFGMLIDITDNFPVLNVFWIIGDTPIQSFLEKIVGYSLGFTLLALGFWMWMPTVIQLRLTQLMLEEHFAELEAKVKVRTASLNKTTEELKRENEERRRSEEKFRNLIESSSDWIWEMGDLEQGGVYKYSSPQAQWILGYSPDELEGTNPYQLMPAEETERVKPILSGLIAEAKPIERLETVHLHKNRNKIVLETSGVPFFDLEGKVIGYRGVTRDITERKEMEDRLRYLANHDILTSLFNRHAFDQKLSEEVDRADRYKHELEPFVRYSFRPAMWEGGDTGVAGLLLDRFDRPEPRHRVQLGLANRLIGAHSADPGSETRYRRVLDLEVTQALDLEPLAGEDEVGPTRFELEGALGPLTLDLDLGVDPTAPRLQEVLGRAGLDWPAGFSLLLEYDYLREGAGYRFGRGRNPGRIHELLLSPAVRLFDSVQLRYLLRYRLADEVLLATGAYLRYASPCGCWSLSLKALALPAEAVPRVYIVVDLSRLGSFGN